MLSAGIFYNHQNEQIMNEILTKAIDDIVKNGINEAAKTDAKLAAAMKTKKMDDCVEAIYQAFYKIACDNRGGAPACALQGQDELIIGAAIHWFTEDNPTKESIVDILKGGTTVHAMKSNKPKEASKASTPSKGSTSKKKAKVATVAADADFDIDGDDDAVSDDSPVEQEPKPAPKPTATPQTLFADADFDID